MTKIKDLTVNQGNIEVEGTITEVGETRNFNKYGKELKVSNAILQDSSGSIKLTLWNDDTSRFKEGDKVKITSGYVSEFQGEKQLTSGKYGKIEKISAIKEIDKGDSELQEIEKELGEEEGNTEDIDDSILEEESF